MSEANDESRSTAKLESLFEGWAGNPPVEYPDMDKDPVSFWCWMAWKKATELEREACAVVAEESSPRHTECGRKIAHKIRMRSNA